MALNPNLIVAASQQPNIMRSLAQGAQTASVANDVRDTNALRSFMQQNGQGVMAGEQNALARLAQVGPQGAQMAMAAQDRQREYQMQQEKLQMARAAAARAASNHAATIGERKAQEEAARLNEALRPAGALLARGDLQGFNMMVAEYGIEPVATMEDATALVAQYEGVAEGLAAYREADALVNPQREPDYVTINGQLVDRAAPGGPAAVPVEGLVERESAPLVQYNYENSTVPEERIAALGSDLNPEDYKLAFGAFDAAAAAASNVADSFGWQPNPVQNRAITAINNANTRFMLVGSASLPGRPSNLTRQEIGKMTPSPGATGEGSALNKSREVASYLANEINAVSGLLMSGQLSSSDQSALSQWLEQATSLFEFYDRMTLGLSGEGRSGNTTSGGVTWSIEE